MTATEEVRKQNQQEAVAGTKCIFSKTGSGSMLQAAAPQTLVEQPKGGSKRTLCMRKVHQTIATVKTAFVLHKQPLPASYFFEATIS